MRELDRIKLKCNIRNTFQSNSFSPDLLGNNAIKVHKSCRHHVKEPISQPLSFFQVPITFKSDPDHNLMRRPRQNQLAETTRPKAQAERISYQAYLQAMVNTETQEQYDKLKENIRIVPLSIWSI
jgi:hypothetical protein